MPLKIFLNPVNPFRKERIFSNDYVQKAMPFKCDVPTFQTSHNIKYIRSTYRIYFIFTFPFQEATILIIKEHARSFLSTLIYDHY